MVYGNNQELGSISLNENLSRGSTATTAKRVRYTRNYQNVMDQMTPYENHSVSSSQ
jgi:hypothetical protein